jgi:diaminopropionate ammonia-lyase
MATLTLDLVKNPKSLADKECLLPFSAAEVKKVRDFHKSMWGYYHATPLVSLPNLAKYLGVKSIYVKDESSRFGLKAFKGLGGSYAIASYLSKRFGVPLDFDALLSLNLPTTAPDLTFATTTDGNHGRGVAWTAKILGVKAVVYMPKGARQDRIKAIQSEGAIVKVTDCNYDDTIRILANYAKTNGWVIVQDTAWPGYEEIPLRIMQGYTTMVGEALDTIKEKPTHVFVQAGVGSLAGAVEAVLVNTYGKDRPVFTVMEAEAANCYYRSFLANKPVAVKGDLTTIMAGLACGEVNPLGWQILHGYSDYALSCHDEVAAVGMRLWGSPLPGDPQIIAGESGAIGGGVLGLLNKYHDIKTTLGLNKDSVLLFFNTEGDTAPNHYRQVVWGGELPISLGVDENA